MKAYRKTNNYTLYLADAWEVLDSLPENSIDAVVTDPPYEIGFMNKGWDNTGVAFDRTTWEKVLRVLKPGGHILAFNHSRTFHRMAVAIEDAGFEIRDTIMWLYGSGFPKSHDISKAIDKSAGIEPIGRKEPTGGITGGNNTNATDKGWNNINNWYEMPPATTEEAKQWEGWGTALKPAYEPILLARKPIPTTVADNVLTHGVGGLNIDECRVGSEVLPEQKAGQSTIGTFVRYDMITEERTGRFPANIIHDGSEEVVEGFPYTITSERNASQNKKTEHTNTYTPNQSMYSNQNTYGDEGTASRFFYTAKASKKDRDEGLRGFDEKSTGELQGGRKEGSAGSVMKDENGERLNPYAGAGAVRRNTHPTVKPTDLMQYLIRLIAPKGATVLDIFMGSGSTGKAAMIENVERDANYHFIGIDRTEEYMPIAEARIEFGLHYLAEKPKADGVVHTDQIDLFSLL
jgi:site-specific DNA-methyltransferase (adenine-specific)